MVGMYPTFVEVFVEEWSNKSWALYGNTKAGCNFIFNDSGENTKHY